MRGSTSPMGTCFWGNSSILPTNKPRQHRRRTSEQRGSTETPVGVNSDTSRSSVLLAVDVGDVITSLTDRCAYLRQVVQLQRSVPRRGADHPLSTVAAESPLTHPQLSSNVLQRLRRLPLSHAMQLQPRPGAATTRATEP